MKSEPDIIYHAHHAELLEDGVLRVPTGGWTGEELFCGHYDVSPDSPDYRFWLWLKQRQKQPWYRLGPVSGLDEEAIAKCRQEYEREHA